MSDTFEKLISDMRGEEPDMPPEYHAYASEQLDGFARRLEALLDGHRVLPVYGEAGAGEPLDQDPPPILADLLGDERPPGSDWVLIDPVKEEPVTGDG